MSKTMFERYIGIDYSGARTPDCSLKGLRAYVATRDEAPQEVPPPPGPRKYWTRRELAGWLLGELSKPVPTMAGLDHGFSFPLRYFEACGLPPDWPDFLEDFRRHWPADKKHTYVDFIRDGDSGNAAARSGSARWRRITEKRAGAKSVFHFDVPGSVAKSTHAGLPWLAHLRENVTEQVKFWPFDGWEVPAGCSAVAEMYPSLWSRQYPREGRTPDQHDAWTIAAWLRQTDVDGALGAFFTPALSPKEKQVARVEGWILGVNGDKL